MAFIRSIEHIANKFATVTPQRTEDYRIGVQNPRKDWAVSTAASESAYETGVQLAITKKRFGKGVKAAGTETWQRAAVEKGTQRWTRCGDGKREVCSQVRTISRRNRESYPSSSIRTTGPEEPGKGQSNSVGTSRGKRAATGKIREEVTNRGIYT